MDDNCIFCKIVEGYIPSYKIYETDNFLAFLDIAQFSEGHTLVIPKTHYRFVWDVPNIGEYFQVVQKVAQHYIKNFNFKYVDSLVYGRMVPHAHVHLVPHNGDNLEWNNSQKHTEDLGQDEERKLTPENGMLLVNKFKIS